MPLKLFNPVFGSGKGLLVRDVVHDYGGLGASVVHGRQAVVPLLASRVPYFKFYCRVIKTYRLSQKSSPNGTLLKFMKLALHKTKHKA